MLEAEKSMYIILFCRPISLSMAYRSEADLLRCADKYEHLL